MKSESLNNNFKLCRKKAVFVFALIFIISMFCKTEAGIVWPGIANSKDGTAISYEVYGKGETTLVFVHGLSCDSRYFRAQLKYFSEKYRVIVLDLAGHGNSGHTRSKYKMESFGEDVKAVIKATNTSKVILIGHSMGGSVIAEAAKLLPEQTIGLIGIDTLENIEYPLSSEQLDQMTAPLKKNFKEGSHHFVKSMIRPESDPVISNWIISDMSAAPPAVALSAMNEYLTQFVNGDLKKTFKQLKIPVVTVNSDMWPINYSGNRKYMHSYDAILIKKSDHFLMMNRPEEFNKALEDAINKILNRK